MDGLVGYESSHCQNGTVRLARGTVQTFQDILQTFDTQDAVIVCQSGQPNTPYETVETSALLLSMSSQFLSRMLGEILEGTLRLDDEKLVLLLPDFSEKAVRGLINCMTFGFHECQDQNELNELQSLLSTLSLNAFKTTEDSVIKNDLLDVATEENVFQDEKPKQMRQRRVPGVPPKSSNKNSSPACGFCGFDGGTLEDSIKHIEDVLDDTGYKIPAPTIRKKGKRYCPICRKDIINTFRLRIHLKVHMKEVHEKTVHCKICEEKFDKT